MEIHRRKPNRLKGYDYSAPGGYFLTICSAERKCIFWNEKEWNKTRWDDATLSPLGKMIDQEIQKWSVAYKSVKIDKYVIMPNHIHIIVIISPPVGENSVLPISNPDPRRGELCSPNNQTEVMPSGRTQFAPTISRMVKQFKGAVTKRIGESVWQKSYYDHVIRDEKDYERIWEYIENNPYGCVEFNFDWL